MASKKCKHGIDELIKTVCDVANLHTFLDQVCLEVNTERCALELVFDCGYNFAAS